MVAWGLLGQDGGDDLGPESVTQFAVSIPKYSDDIEIALMNKAIY